MNSPILFVAGASCKSAPLEILEALSRHLSGDGTAEIVKMVEESACPLDEAGLLATCNRLEIYGVSSGDGAGRVRDYLQALAGSAAGAVYLKQDAQALRHLFCVASGLDSMVLGETEILGQVKTAYEQARSAGLTKSVLNTVFQRALYVGKLVRSDTQIAQGRLSVASVALELAGKIFADFSRLHVAVVGAGSMGLETAKRLLQSRPRQQTFLSRTRERAEALAQEFGGAAATMEDLPSVLKSADIILLQARSTMPLLTKPVVQEARRGISKNCFLIDIAMPRNVEEGVARVPGVFLYNLDDLKAIAETNYEKRRQEVEKAEQLVAEEVSKFLPQCHQRLAQSRLAQELPVLP